MDLIKMYCDNVIQPIEEERNRLRAKVYSKNIFDLLMRKKYKEYLDKYDDLLMECYRKLEHFLEDN